jgi:hypothetical protein
MIDFSKEFTLKGKWWTDPNDKDENKQIFGELSFSHENGLQLILEGSLFETKSIFHARSHIHIPCLVGFSKDHRYITLFNLLGYEEGHSKWISSTFSVEFCLINSEPYFANPEMSVTGFNFSTNFFSAFFAGYNQNFRVNTSKDGVVVDYKEVQPLAILDNCIKAYFMFIYRGNGLGSVMEEFNLTERIYLNVFFEEPVLPNDLIRKLSFYRDLFIFLSNSKVSINTAHAFSRDQHGKQISFDFLFSDPAHSAKTTMARYQALLPYKELKEDFSNIFQQWVDHEQTIQSGLLLYLQSKYLHFPSPIQQFLNTVFAIETLHNTYFDQPRFTQTGYEQFKVEKKKAIVIFSPQFKSNVTDCLGHVNVLSFAERLLDLIERTKKHSVYFIYDIPDFCKRVKLQRNFLAHNHSEETRSTIPQEHYLYFIAMLHMLFELSFMQVLGFDAKHLDMFVKRHDAYQYYLQRIDILKSDLLKQEQKNTR